MANAIYNQYLDTILVLQSVKFCLSNTSEGKILKIMTNSESSEAAGVDKLSAIFLKMAPTF